MKILCVGKIDLTIKTKVDFYLKQMHDIELIEVKDYYSMDLIAKEGKLLLDHIKEDDYVITLEINGKVLDTIEFKNKLDMLNNKNVVLIIGGSFGLDESVIKRSNFALSLSKMTLSHAIARLVLVEQIYRAKMINKNHPYHK